MAKLQLTPGVDTGAVERFGEQSARDGGLLAISGASTATLSEDEGVVAIFDLAQGVETRRFRELLGPGISFGFDIDLHAGRLLVGAPQTAAIFPGFDDPGQVFLYDAQTGATLQTFTSGFGQILGADVALNSTHLFLGDGLGERVEVYDVQTGAFVQFIEAAGFTQGFASELECDDDLLLVTELSSLQPTSRVFVYDAATFTLQGILNSPNVTGFVGDQFGASLGLSEDYVIVGAHELNLFPISFGIGAAYVFDRTTLQLVTPLLSGAPELFQTFGESVAVSGDRALVGAPRDNTPGTFAGRAYLYELPSGQLLDTLTPFDQTPEDFFGVGCQLFDGMAFVGATQATGAAGDTGAAYLFDLEGDAWLNVGPGLAGAAGVPQLVGSGDFTPGAPITLDLSGAAPLSPALLVAGIDEQLYAPFFGGVLVPALNVELPGTTDGAGAISWATPAPFLPVGTTVLLQYWVLDPSAPQGVAASNGLSATVF
ncbi:MAG: FG-GAP repeat protein [Planctomycetota bacterium]